MITMDKIFRSIEHYISIGKKHFILYPYGTWGKRVEHIIKNNYPDIEYILADNYLKKDGIYSVGQLKNFPEDYILFLCTDRPDLQEDIHNSLKGNFSGKICDFAQPETEECSITFHFANPKMQIEEISPQQRKAVFERTKRAWKKLGEEEPYFSVITHEEMKTQNITKETLSDFFLSGRAKTAEICASLERNDIGAPGQLHILELGCGCGRITKSLAERFGHVTAIDISEGNLKIAKEHVVSDHVEFVLIKEVEEYLKLPRADVIYSVIVLQHNCPPVIEYILRAMMDRLNPGGLFMFQIPTYLNGYSFVYEDYMKRPEGMEMHCFPQNRIFEIAYASHCVPLEVFPYNSTGRSDNSMMFLLQKDKGQFYES